MDFLYTVVGFVQAGGAFMYPILIVFAVGAAVALERIVMLARVRGKNRKVWDTLHPVMSEGDFDEARKLTSEDDSFISQLLGMGLAREGAVRRRDDIEIGMEEAMMETVVEELTLVDLDQAIDRMLHSKHKGRVIINMTA